MLRGILAALVVLLLLASCGGGGSPSNASPDNGWSPDPGVLSWGIPGEKSVSNGGFEWPASGFTDSFILYASNDDVPVGTVTFSAGADALHVTFETTGDWFMSDVHLDLAPCGELPGNYKPVPGQMPWISGHDIDVQTYTFDIGYEELYDYLVDEWDYEGDCLPWYTDCGLCFVAHAAVFRVLEEPCDTQWASEVVDYDQGTKKNGDPVNADRSDPNNALGEPDSFNGNIHFYSLGFDMVPDDYTDAWIILGYDHDIYNGPATDITTIEITWGDGYPLECAEVYVWDTVTNAWVYCGTVTNVDNGTDENWDTAQIPAGVVPDNRVKLVDCTDPSIHASDADGFDLDALKVTYFCTEEETAFGGENKYYWKGARWFRWDCWRMHKALPAVPDEPVWYKGYTSFSPKYSYWGIEFLSTDWPEGDFAVWPGKYDDTDYWRGWCAASSGNQFLMTPGASYQVMLFDSYDPNQPWRYHPTLGEREWDKVNWLINAHRDGLLDGANWGNVQMAIWHFLLEPYHGSVRTSPNATDLWVIGQADEYGDGYTPGCGDWVAMVAFDATPTWWDGNESYGYPAGYYPDFQVNIVEVDP